MYSIYRRSVTALLAIAPVFLAGCGLGGIVGGFTAEDTQERTFFVKDSPRVLVDTFNGAMHVSVVDGDKVITRVTKRTRAGSQDVADEALHSIVVSMTQASDGSVTVKASVAQNASRTNREVDVDLQVPAGTQLELHTTNGSIVAAGSYGEIVAESTNGNLEAVGGTGNTRLTTTNGTIVVKGGRGEAILKTSNGQIKVSAISEAKVIAQTTNGSIEFTGRPGLGESQFRTTNGHVILMLPDDAEFSVDGETSNGKVHSEFALTRSTKKRRSYLKGVVGDHGGAILKLQTSNGNIELRKSH